jgi:uncharacterized protein
MSWASVFRILVPKDKKFMPLLEQDADNLVKAAILLNKFFLISDVSEQEQIIRQIKEHEKIGDDITHQIFDELNRSFITPFDREDIYSINSSMDDILDFINGGAQKFRLYRPKIVLQQFLEISELILDVSREVKTAISGLHNLKNSHDTMNACIRINEIENMADEVYHTALSELFEKETNAIELIKIKDILSVLEEATDKAEDVSDVIKSVIIKMA